MSIDTLKIEKIFYVKEIKYLEALLKLDSLTIKAI